MAVITEKELPPNSRPLWLKATSAIETRNFGYAVSLLQVILKESPNFLMGRQWLRRAEIATTKSKKGFMSGLSSGSIQAMKSQGLIKKDPQAAILAAEEIMEKEPLSIQANSLLRDAAAAAGMIETVGFALETMRDSEPKNIKIMHELARHYSASDQAEKAIEIYNHISAINPADIEAIKGGKDAAARASMRTGGWDQIGKDGVSYRDVLKNAEEAKSLEQQSRIVKSDDMIEQQLTENFALYNENPNNLDVVRKIADLYEKKDDLENAVQYYRWAVELTKGGDPGLVRNVNNLTLKNLDRMIGERTSWLQDHAGAANGENDDETRATVGRVEGELENFRQQKSEMLINTARARVDRNPSDLNFRFELGSELVQAKQYTEAIAELQRAQNSPNLGQKAKYLLGQCFEAKNVLPLALKQYEDVRAKLQNMDALKKDVTYRLGLVYERAGEKDKYLACMTEIYEVDSSFQDVAARVEGGYAM